MNGRASLPVANRSYPLWLALLGPLAAAALMVPLRGHVPNTDLALAMVVAVALVVLPGWRMAALVAGVSAGVWFDFWSHPALREVLHPAQRRHPDNGAVGDGGGPHWRDRRPAPSGSDG